MPVPDTVMAPPNQASHPGDVGVCKALSEWTGRAATAQAGTPREATPEKELGRHHSQEHRRTRISVYTTEPRTSRRNATTAVFPPVPKKVDEQEAVSSAYRQCSGESVALPVWDSMKRFFSYKCSIDYSDESQKTPKTRNKTE
ncbi:hypothetical protein NDU88_001975 [Pleurodeles waltl]|uniref:Uncharacterized protein n=1 Tax=Pleurodeles waltl TaxID=8319 RepID=A0AAV7T1W2_PLEWA|nr:hypothetical protein NDU88_001975 [Pleurodeles waltl]